MPPQVSRIDELLDLLFHDGPLSREQKDRLCILAADEQLLIAVGDEVFKPDVPTACRTTRAQREHTV
jgi:hypothetical protein